MGGRGKEGRGLPAAERAAVERELELPPSLPRLPGECENPAGLGGAGSWGGIAVSGGGRGQRGLRSASREPRGRGGSAAAAPAPCAAGLPCPGGAVPAPPAAVPGLALR